MSIRSSVLVKVLESLMHVQFPNRLALASGPIQITNQQNPQQQLRIDRRTTGFTILSLSRIAQKPEVDMQVILWYT